MQIKKENILIITDIPPCKNYFYGNVISQFFRLLLEEKHNIYSFCVMDENLKPHFDESVINDIDINIFDRPNEVSGRNKYDIIKYYYKIRKLNKELYHYFRKKRITKILCVIQDEVILELANFISNKTNLPYTVDVWDSIERCIKENKFDNKRKKRVFNLYKKIINNAKYCITNSYETSNEYEKKFNTKCITVTEIEKCSFNQIEYDNIKNPPKIKNIEKQIDNNFSFQVNKKNLFQALCINYQDTKKMRILEVNNIDLPGKRFNGFDLLNMINNDTEHSAKQIVIDKISKENKVIEFFNNKNLMIKERELILNEQEKLSVHSNLSMTSNILLNNDNFIHADVVHYHLVHNTNLSLYQMIELVNIKPSILSFHDSWYFTGRCVTPQECTKWETGCKNCQSLDTMFDLPIDNCNSLWKLKKMVYKNLDIDIVVSSRYMEKMLKKSPLTKHFENVHIIPFGIDLNKFNNTISRKSAKQKLGINSDDIVLFFRAQLEFKGTEFIVEALKKLETTKKITLLTCSGTGLLDQLKEKYNVIDLGHIDDEKLIISYNACDIFLMPSISESFGMMAIEAMSCSRPVIIFNNTALPEVTFAPECGVLVDNKDAKQLMLAIRRLIENPDEREARGKLGRQLAEKHYDINTYHKKIMDLYKQAYERKRKHYFLDYSINNDSIEVKYLLNKLFDIYDDIFHYKLTNFKKTYIHQLPKKIDYSNQNAQNFIRQVNNKLYDNICNENKKDYSYLFKKRKINNFTFFYDVVKNRQKLKNDFKNCENLPFLYKVFRLCYRILKKIKKTLYNEYYKEQNKYIYNLEKNVEMIIKQNKIMEQEIEELKKIVENQAKK